MARHPTRAARLADRSAVAAVLASAFGNDPAMAWLWPDAARRHRRLPGFFRIITATDADPAHCDLSLAADGSIAAAAVWRPPGGWDTPTAAMIPALPALLGCFGTALPRALGLQSAMAAHHPRAPHWYLQYAGCTPAQQGRGHGGAAIRARLARCDAQGLPCALETATPANVGLYQSLGFRVTETFRHHDAPMFWAMWREPAR